MADITDTTNNFVSRYWTFFWENSLLLFSNFLFFFFFFSFCLGGHFWSLKELVSWFLHFILSSSIFLQRDCPSPLVSLLEFSWFRRWWLLHHIYCKSNWLLACIYSFFSGHFLVFWKNSTTHKKSSLTKPKWLLERKPKPHWEKGAHTRTPSWQCHLLTFLFLQAGEVWRLASSLL